jgi:hypothetical protein
MKKETLLEICSNHKLEIEIAKKLTGGIYKD